MEAISTCKISVDFLGFAKIYATPSDDICAAIVCTQDGCGLKSKQGDDETLFVQKEALRPILMQKFERIASADANEEEREATEPQDEEAEPFESPYAYALWQWSSIFSFAITFSLLGITTSVVTRRGISLGGDVSKDVRGFIIVYFMAIGSGLIMVSLFAGGFLQGSMFPDFSGDMLNFGFNTWSALSFRGDD